MIDGFNDADLRRLGAQWCERIRASEKRDKEWIDMAERAEAAYSCDDTSDALPQMNILHSNVETITPACFNSAPIPDIRPRHGSTDDPIAKVAADIFERVIAAQIDDSVMEVEVEANAQDAFMAGRGIVRVKFDADDVVDVDPMTGEQIESVTNERVSYEVVSWRDYRRLGRVAQRPWLQRQRLRAARRDGNGMGLEAHQVRGFAAVGAQAEAFAARVRGRWTAGGAVHDQRGEVP